MQSFAKWCAAALVAVTLAVGTASANPPVVVAAPPPVVSYAPPVVVPAPVVTTTYYAPVNAVPVIAAPGPVVTTYRYGLFGLRKGTIVTYPPAYIYP
jgi:hypothetical protein